MLRKPNDDEWDQGELKKEKVHNIKNVDFYLPLPTG